ncbi:MAG: hypothetical protein IH955_09285 [Chloroflexi bacterium]|nr:hypothetical protein [Chloroflexota bacterium]
MISCLYKDLKFRRKALDDIRDRVSDALKRRNDGAVPYSVTTLRKAYLRGDSNFHVHISQGHGGINSPNFCAIFQRHPCLQHHTDVMKHNIESPVFDCKSGGLTEPHVNASDSEGNHLNLAMFVSVIDLMQKPKGTPPLSIPSVVWLQLLERCNESPFEIAEPFTGEPAFPPSPLATGTIPKDGEFGSPCFTVDVGAQAGRWVSNKLADEDIKSGTKIVSNLTDSNRPLERRLLGVKVSNYAKSVLARLRISFGSDDSIGITGFELAEFQIQGIDVFPCPPNLVPYAVERMHDLTIGARLPASQSETDSNEA